MAALGGFPGHHGRGTITGSARTSAPIAPRHRQLIADAVERRRAWHEQAGTDSMETWPAYDTAAWLGRLEDVLDVVRDAITADGDVDPRAALVDVVAVASAWTDQMGDPPTT